MLQKRLDEAIKAKSPMQVVDLINKGAEVNFCGKNGETPLFTAARRGDTDTAHTLLALGADLEHQNENGETALFFAAANKNYLPTKADPTQASDFILQYESNPEVFDLLLDQGADPLHRDSDGKSMLHNTIYNRQLKISTRLIELGVDPCEITDKGENLLFAAIFSDDLDCLKYCLRLGMDINRINNDGDSPVTIAANLGDFVDYGDFGDLDESASFVIFNSSPGMLEFLLKQGADPLHRDSSGNGLLHSFEVWENIDLAKELIASGLDVHAQNDLGMTPLFYSCWSNSAVAGIELLLEQGVNINHENRYGKNLLFFANDSDLFDHLVEIGADFRAIDHFGATLLHGVPDDLVIAKKLISLGLDVNRPDKQGNTPLFYAAKTGARITQYLLDHGADPTHKNNEGKCYCDYLLPP